MMIALLWMVLLVTVYIMTYLWNKKTPKPEDCEEMSECSGCANITCSHHSAHQKEENI